MKETIKEYLNDIINALVKSNNTSYSKLKERSFEVGQICACIDLINQIIDYDDEISFKTYPCLAFYRKCKKIAIEEI